MVVEFGGLSSEATPAGRVLSDRSVLVRYLNPNLVYVATVKHEMHPQKGADSSLTLYLIDTVRGAILHRLQHRHSSDPVVLTYSENLVVYQYWNVHSTRFEVSVLELFEPDLDWKRFFFQHFNLEN